MINRIRNKSRELYRYREMFWGLVSREVRARYKGSVLGFLWSLLNPLLMMAVYSLVFAVFMRIQIPHYAVFLFCGLLPWSWFTTTLTNGAAAIVANSNLIKKVYFPLEILPLVNVTTNLVNFLFSLPVLALFMLISGVPFTVHLLALPVLLLIQFALTLGLALLLATLNAFFRDVEQLLGPLLLAWFYVTPVIYPADMIPQGYKFLFWANPMAPLIVSYQDVLYRGQAPDFRHLIYAGLSSVVLFLVGYALFYRQKFNFAEVV